MLYELDKNFQVITALPYLDMGDLQKREKDLEDLLAKNLFENLFEDKRLLPFHQERQRQSEADLYAINEHGDVVIFELKVGAASPSALHQLLRYVEDAGRWRYTEIEKKLHAYPHNVYGNEPLKIIHQKAFGLDTPLKEDHFNSTQHMMVIGNAADEQLIRSVEYWRRKGLSVDLATYRIYVINEKPHFEFYSKPYDSHANPGQAKGVLFDTCATSWDRGKPLEPLELMIKNRKVSAWGNSKYAVYSLVRGDVVFYYHSGVGIIAAGKIVGSKLKENKEDEECYWDVQFLTPVPTNFKQTPKGLPVAEIENVTGKSFFWARTAKVPFLSKVEAEKLLTRVKEYLERVHI